MTDNTYSIIEIILTGGATHRQSQRPKSRGEAGGGSRPPVSRVSRFRSPHSEEPHPRSRGAGSREPGAGSREPLPPPAAGRGADRPRDWRATMMAGGDPNGVPEMLPSIPPPPSYYARAAELEAPKIPSFTPSNFGFECVARSTSLLPGEEQLYREGMESMADMKGEFVRLVEAAVGNFLMLLECAKVKAHDHETYSSSLKTVFLNLQALTASMRTHQAREDMLDALRRQVAAVDEATASLKAALLAHEGGGGDADADADGGAMDVDGGAAPRS